MQEKIRMILPAKVLHNVLQQCTIFLTALVARHHLGILLDTPHRPKQNIRMLHFVHFNIIRLIINKVMNCLAGRFHHHFKLSHFINRQCQSRQGNKHIARTAFKPRISCQNIKLISLFIQELMSSIYQTVLEIITWSTFFHLFFKGSL